MTHNPATPLRLPPMPAPVSSPHESRAAAVVPALLGAATGVGFSLVAGDARYLLVSLATAALSVGVLLATRRARGRHDRRRAAELRAAYLDQVAAVAGAAEAAARRQRSRLELTYPPPAALVTDRTQGDHDSPGPVGAMLRIGVGEIDADVRVELPAGDNRQPGDSADAGDPLGQLGPSIAAAAARIPGAPVLLDPGPGGLVALVGDPELTRALVRAWVVGAAARHPPEDLRIAVATSGGESDPHWAWARWLPHTGPGPASGLDRAARSIGEVLSAGGPDEGAAGTGPSALRVLDGLPYDRSWPGCTTLALCRTPADAPDPATLSVTLRPDGTLTVAELLGRSTDGVVPDRLDIEEAAGLARALAAAQPRTTGPRPDSLAVGSDPGAVSLLPLLDSAPAAPLAVPLGRAELRGPVVLDLAEAASGGHGPHGLVVGATGSGKSELLRTLVLGLAVRSRPDEVAFLLVDFKGGAAFDPLAGLPHVTGLVTNLESDASLAARVQDALEGELDERQGRLRAAGAASLAALRDSSGEGDGEPFPSLVVVVDEFGELLELRPELLDTFTRVGRLGRSLGVHLLLSSQRLEEGRLRGLESHLRYRVALRTFTAAESVAALGSAAAHGLPPRPGAALLGVDGATTRFQAATTSAACSPGGPRPVEIVRRLHGPGGTPQSPALTPGNAAGPTELDLLVRRASTPSGRPARPICLPPLPSRLSLSELDHRGPGVPLGMSDDPRRRRQPPVRLDLGGADAHVAVAGRAGSGRSTFLRTLAHSVAARHDPSRWQVLAIDLGGGMLAQLLDLPHTSAVAAGHDHDAVRRVADEAAAVVAERAAALASAGLASFADLERLPPDQARSVLPDDERARLLVLIDDCGRLRREHPDVDDDLTRVAAGGRAVGLHLALTCARWLDVRPALLDLVDIRLELGVADPGDSRWDRERLARVPPGPGGGLSAEGRPMRLAGSDGGQSPARHPDGISAPGVRTLPREIRADRLAWRSATQARGFVLGVRERRLEPVLLDLAAPGAHLLVLGDAGSGRSTLLRRAALQLADTGGPAPPARLHVVDPGRSLLSLTGHGQTAAHAYEPRSLAELLGGLLRELTARLPPTGLDPHELAERAWWTGPDHVLVVDDHDLTAGWSGPGATAHGGGVESALAALAGLLPVARDIGLHVLLARPVTGIARASYDPFLSRLRECAPITVVLSGDRSEGPVAGEVCASPGPPGRGRLVRAGQPPLLVQCCLPAQPP